MRQWFALIPVAAFALIGIAVAIGWYLGSLPIDRPHLPMPNLPNPVAHVLPTSIPKPKSTPKPTPDTRWFGEPGIWQPPDIPGARIEYFTVSGSTQWELITSLNANSPKNPNGEIVGWGVAAWEHSGGTCYSPRTVDLPVDVVVTLPRWTPLPDGTVDQDLVTKWNALQQTIYVHEVGHVKIDIDDWTAAIDYIHQLSSCQAVINYIPTAEQKIRDDNDAYHARLKADCRPEIGCFPRGWLGW